MGRRTQRRRVEWPTLIVAVAIHGGWLATTWWNNMLPPLPLAVIGACLIAWHGSLQHETIHGHPTPWHRLNDFIGSVPLSLWLPYRIYQRSHVAHHHSPAITDPLLDPESRYVGRADRVALILAFLQGTLAGRLIFGPPIAIATLAAEEVRRVLHAPRAVVRDWLPHLTAAAVLCLWLHRVQFGIGQYVLLIVYPGMSLTLLRSFAEHRADLDTPGRAATVERGGLLGLLYLNNHLHAAHHDRPDLAWYRLPAYHRHHRTRLTGEGRHGYRDYGQILRRFAWRRHDVLRHPAHDEATI